MAVKNCKTFSPEGPFLHWPLERVIVQARLSVSTCLVRKIWAKWTMSRRWLASIMHIKSAAFIPLKSNILLSFARWCKQYHKVTKWVRAQEKSAFSQWNWYFPSARSLQLICTSMKMGPRIFYGTVFCTQCSLKSFKVSLHLNYISLHGESESSITLRCNIQNRNVRKYNKCWSSPCMLTLWVCDCDCTSVQIPGSFEVEVLSYGRISPSLISIQLGPSF